MFGVTLGRTLVAGAILGLLGISLFPGLNKSTAGITIAPSINTPVLNEIFSVDILLAADEPVNVFTGILVFDSTQILIESIEYHTSVADLWAEEPWYSNGAGTLTFTGGSTNPGGFTGTEKILTVFFKPIQTGECVLSMKNVRILKHDGLGTDAQVSIPLDTLLIVSENTSPFVTEYESTTISAPNLFIVTEEVDTDLNRDGEQTIADTSIFMTHLFTQDLRSDFNQDGTVNVQDLSILNSRK